MTRSRLVRPLIVLGLGSLFILGPVGSAIACGGLIAPNGTISLLRTTTLAAYHHGVEHYVTSFEYAGKSSGDVGSIIPLPGVPTKVIKGGAWTLQRLEIETHPQPAFERLAAAPEADAAIELMRVQIDALDITVLQGGAVAVGNWAREHGFFLPPDAPEVLAFYAQRSPIFLAARFNAARAARQGVQQGEGTPVHIVIPTPNPWVPLRILALGRSPTDLIQADVFLLTDRRPALLPLAERSTRDPDQHGIIQEVSEPASDGLMTDLRSDRGMRWMPADGMWLTFLRVNDPASDLTHDLAIDASGFGHPDPVAAGYMTTAAPPYRAFLPLLLVALLSLGLFGIVTVVRRPPAAGATA